MRGATAATLPPAMATSRTALMPFLGSMTCPPRRRRSYFGSAAEPARGRRPTARTTEDGDRFTRIMRSAPSRGAPPRRPAAAQVFAHVEGAAHLVARDLAGERVVEGVAASARRTALRRRTVSPSMVPREVAGHEVAAMGAVDLVRRAGAGVRAWLDGPGRVFDRARPTAAEVRGGGRGRRRLVLARRVATGARTAGRPRSSRHRAPSCTGSR